MWVVSGRKQKENKESESVVYSQNVFAPCKKTSFGRRVKNREMVIQNNSCVAHITLKIFLSQWLV